MLQGLPLLSLETLTPGYSGGTVGRALWLESRMSWVQVPSRVAFFFGKAMYIAELFSLHLHSSL